MNKWIFVILYFVTFNVIAINVEELNKKYHYNNGEKDPIILMAKVLSPLKNGVNGLNESKKLSGGNSITENSYNSYSNQQMLKQGSNPILVSEDSVFTDLSIKMGDKGVLTKVRLISKDDQKLNGHVQNYVYELSFSNGKTHTVQFNLLKTSISGGFLITKFNSFEN